ncbi:MAG: phage holin family protein [Nitrospira sp.]|jgi:hypothetical protein|nr:phage holin family protein [Nitrospira sp.]ULA67784.1 MAG: Phage holin family protein [Nitrospira sp.]
MENPHPISIASLVTGLVEDLRRLFAQEIQLARHEMQHELGKVVKGAMHAGIAIMLAMLATLFLLMTLVHVLHSYSGLPLWGCYGIVGLLSAAGGAAFFVRLLTIGATLRLWPFRTFYSLKEDAKWIKEQLLSIKT